MQMTKVKITQRALDVVSTFYFGGRKNVDSVMSTDVVSTLFYNVGSTSINQRFFYVESKLILVT